MSKSKAELLAEAKNWAQKHAGEGGKIEAVSQAVANYELIAAEIADLYAKLESKNEERKASFRKLEATFKDAKKTRKQRDKAGTEAVKEGKPESVSKNSKKRSAEPAAGAPESAGAAPAAVITEA